MKKTLFFLAILLFPWRGFAITIPDFHIPLSSGMEGESEKPGALKISASTSAQNDIMEIATELVGAFGERVMKKAEDKMFGRADELLLETFTEFAKASLSFPEMEGLIKSIGLRGLVTNPELILRPVVSDSLSVGWRAVMAKAVPQGESDQWLVNLKDASPLTDVLAGIANLPSFESAALSSRMEWEFRRMVETLVLACDAEFQNLAASSLPSLSPGEVKMLRIYLGARLLVDSYPNGGDFPVALMKFLEQRKEFKAKLDSVKEGSQILASAEEFYHAYWRVLDVKTPASEKLRGLAAIVCDVAGIVAGDASGPVAWLRGASNLFEAYIDQDWSSLIVCMDGVFEEACASAGMGRTGEKPLRILASLVHYGAIRLHAVDQVAAEQATDHLLDALDSLVLRDKEKGQIGIDFGGNLGGFGGWSWVSGEISSGAVSFPIALDLGFQLSLYADGRSGLLLQLNGLALGEYVRFEEGFILSRDFDFYSVIAPSVYVGCFFDAPTPFFIALRMGWSSRTSDSSFASPWFAGVCAGLRVPIFSVY